MKKYLLLLVAFLAVSFNVNAATLGYADVVLDYYNSGTGTFSTAYGGTYPGGPGYPILVSTDVVLGNESNTSSGFPDFLSLPTGSYVTVGFTDEVVIDGLGDDIFIAEPGSMGERAEIYVSSDNITFTFLGIAFGGGNTSFDLASIGYLSAVTAVTIVGLDNSGGSPGFDVLNVKINPGSIGFGAVSAVPLPAAAFMFAPALLGFFGLRRKAKQAA